MFLFVSVLCGKGTFVVSTKHLNNTFIGLCELFLSLLTYFWWSMNISSVASEDHLLRVWIKWSSSLAWWGAVGAPILKEWPL
jgi:hypothetical protein